MLKQALEVAKLATANIETQEKIIEDALRILSNYKSYKTSPELARAIHQCVKINTGLLDPYANIKKKDLDAAKSLYISLKEFLSSKEDQLYWALKIAATGNNIDAAIYGDINIVECINTELEREFSICDIDIFRKKLVNAKTILIIGDNTGETIFDKILIEHMSEIKIIYAVRSEPIINDVTMADALASGLNEVATIISSGCDAPGLLLEECNAAFIKIYNNADIIISKGQGNYEALSEEENIFFLLKAKCSIIASRLQCNLNDYILKFNKGD